MQQFGVLARLLPGVAAADAADQFRPPYHVVREF